MTAEEFVEKWSGVELSERQASQEHFIDLCGMLEVETPAQADKTGENYCVGEAVKVMAAARNPTKSLEATSLC